MKRSRVPAAASPRPSKPPARRAKANWSPRLPRLDALIADGATTVEIKSGYGLSLDDEINQLHAARALAGERKVTIVTTFLGAHSLPPEAVGGKDDYIDLVCREMIPAVARESSPMPSTRSARPSRSRPSRPPAYSKPRRRMACA